jgi:MFS family permease
MAGVIYYLLIPYGWRAVFLFGLFPAVLGLFIRVFVDESKMWEMACRQDPPSYSESISELKINSIFIQQLLSGPYAATHFFIYCRTPVQSATHCRHSLDDFGCCDSWFGLLVHFRFAVVVVVVVFTWLNFVKSTNVSSAWLPSIVRDILRDYPDPSWNEDHAAST